MTGRGFAPGKLILSGEHAVVYGHPALAMAVSRGTTVALASRPGASGVDSATQTASNGEIVPFPADDRLAPAVATLLPATGIGVHIHTDLPVGRGMGSSAALAVALVRALASAEGRVADFDECHTRGFAVERVFHGTPSGLDHAVATLGGGLRYRRVDGKLELHPLELPPLRLVVLDSGLAGDTAALVAAVRARRPAVDPVLDQIGALVGRVEAALAGPLDALGALLTENHRLLQQLGVSTPDLDDLVTLALRAGAFGAKLAGAGGGGVVFALTEDPAPVLAAAQRAGVAAFPVEPFAVEAP